ncbi:MAG: hypothetical protein ABIQ16_24850 [Polyangiaceae bacterium]
MATDDVMTGFAAAFTGQPAENLLALRRLHQLARRPRFEQGPSFVAAAILYSMVDLHLGIPVAPQVSALAEGVR